MLRRTSSRARVIGSVFGLPEAEALPTGQIPPFWGGKHLLLVNARTGILLLIDLLSPPQVWMPSYLCPTMLQAVDSATTQLRFYSVSDALNVTSLDWIAEVQPGDLVVLIDYFGWPCTPALASRIRERGAWILEDACQALLSEEIGEGADFLLFSPRKFVGVPDGGILISKGAVDLAHISLSPVPAAWWIRSLYVNVLRREFDLHGGERHWSALFQRVEAEQPIERYAMSAFSQTLLKSLDYAAIAQQRVKNYERLRDRLGHIALFPQLAAGVVPLGFPIRLEERDRIRQVLFTHQIYPPIHWSLQGLVPSVFRESHRLAREIMTLPCDQRYGRQEMDQMSDLILRELA